MSKTFVNDGDHHTEPAGTRYTCRVTFRKVAGQEWFEVALREGGSFGLGGQDLPGWVATYADVNRSLAEQQRVVGLFSDGASVEQVEERRERAQDDVERGKHYYSNVNGFDAAREVERLTSLAVAQWQYDMVSRFELAAA